MPLAWFGVMWPCFCTSQPSLSRSLKSSNVRQSSSTVSNFSIQRGCSLRVRMKPSATPRHSGSATNYASTSARPDRREAHRIIEELPLRAPVLAWHASEFNCDRRLPGFIWAPDSSDDAQIRTQRVLQETGSSCVVVLAPWGNNPAICEGDVSVIASAEAPGLAQPQLGTDACKLPLLPGEWTPAP